MLALNKINRILFINSIIFFEQCYIFSAEPIISDNVRNADDKEFPFIVSISDDDDEFDAIENHVCTGSLISLKHVLTAAHCLKDKEVNDVQIIVGSHDLTRGIKYKPICWKTYEEWAKETHTLLYYPTNDIAVITLAKSVHHAGLKLPTLSSFPSNIVYGSNARLIGWGGTDLEEADRYLTTASVQVLSKEDCDKRVADVLKRKISNAENVLCTAATPYAVVTCGDSGGPLLDENNVILGVTKSICPSNAEPFDNKVNVHDNVYYYNKFITEMMSEEITSSLIL